MPVNLRDGRFVHFKQGAQTALQAFDVPGVVVYAHTPAPLRFSGRFKVMRALS